MRICRQCGRDLPPESTARREFCDDTCRKAHHAATSHAVILPEIAARPDAVADAYLAPHEPVEQLAVAVLHARSLARVFLRLSRTVPAPLAWRSATVGVDLTTSLDDNFPDTE
jgi:hypothetical protein